MAMSPCSLWLNTRKPLAKCQAILLSTDGAFKMSTSDGKVRLGAGHHDLQSLHGLQGRRNRRPHDDEGAHDFADCRSVADVYRRGRN